MDESTSTPDTPRSKPPAPKVLWKSPKATAPEPEGAADATESAGKRKPGTADDGNAGEFSSEPGAKVLKRISLTPGGKDSKKRERAADSAESGERAEGGDSVEASAPKPKRQAVKSVAKSAWGFGGPVKTTFGIPKRSKPGVDSRVSTAIEQMIPLPTKLRGTGLVTPWVLAPGGPPKLARFSHTVVLREDPPTSPKASAGARASRVDEPSAEEDDPEWAVKFLQLVSPGEKLLSPDADMKRSAKEAGIKLPRSTAELRKRYEEAMRARDKQRKEKAAGPAPVAFSFSLTSSRRTESHHTADSEKSASATQSSGKAPVRFSFNPAVQSPASDAEKRLEAVIDDALLTRRRHESTRRSSDDLRSSPTVDVPEKSPGDEGPAADENGGDELQQLQVALTKEQSMQSAFEERLKNSLV